MIHTEISEFLTKIIARKNIRMDDIASLVGVSPAFLSNLKKGKKSCKEETWAEIIDYLRLDDEEKKEAWKVWSLDRMDNKTKKYLLDLENENDKLKKILDTIDFVKSKK